MWLLEMKSIGTGDYTDGLHGRLGQSKRKVSKLEKRYKKNYLELNSGRCRDGSIRKIKRYEKWRRRLNINLIRVPKGGKKREMILKRQ